ncbi:MAG: hypothetical protein WCP12_00890 [bacterium]
MSVSTDCCYASSGGLWMVLAVFAAFMQPGVSRSESTTISRMLENEAYRIQVLNNGTLELLPAGSKAAFVFRPEFTALLQFGTLTLVGAKCQEPVYNLVGWKIGASKDTILDVYQTGERRVLDQPVVTVFKDHVEWKFSGEDLEVSATVRLPEGAADPVLTYSVVAKKNAFYSVAYSGAPAASLKDAVEVWQPLIWDGRRLPVQSYLMSDVFCSIPGCLVETAQGTCGVMADPLLFPYEMPNGRNTRFGVVLRNAEGRAQPLVFAPVPGTVNAKFKPGQRADFTLVLVARNRSLSATFEHVARAICKFRDVRENTLATLNQALDNMIDFALSEKAEFSPADRAFTYHDSKGTVKNVSALHPLSVGQVMDNEKLFHEQGIPILEYLMSREKFLFAFSAEARNQTPSRNMSGPAMPIAELAALQRMTGGASPIFLEEALRLHGVDRMLNMEWVSPKNAWQNDLWLYRATRDMKYLEASCRKADRYIAERIDKQPTDFKEAGVGTFFDYMTPAWKELYELYVETRNAKYLEAAHRGARRYAQFIWFFPAVPEGDIAVNQSGFAPRRGSDQPSAIPVQPETVPAWRVSEQGLMAEGNGTAGRLGILLATHAPWFRRIGFEAKDPFLSDIARSAVIGRYANFPGYHVNTAYSTAQEKFEFPLHTFTNLARVTSFHFNHVLPMANLALDYLMADAYAVSKGLIDFPSEYTEGYAYLAAKVYGAPGRFYDVGNVYPWMPKGLVTTDTVQLNYVAGRTEDTFCLALVNQCARELKDVTVRLDGNRFAQHAKGTFPARCWVDNQLQKDGMSVENGICRVSVPAKGLVALAVSGLKPVPTFQDKVRPAAATPVMTPSRWRLKAPQGDDVVAMVLSFGPELTWLYAYQTGTSGTVKALALTVKTTSRSCTLRDEAFPFEFTLPLSEKERILELSLEAEAVNEQKAQAAL